jgi:Ca2+-binding EF-hand superfamily protein
MSKKSQGSAPSNSERGTKKNARRVAPASIKTGEESRKVRKGHESISPISRKSPKISPVATKSTKSAHAATKPTTVDERASRKEHKHDEKARGREGSAGRLRSKSVGRGESVRRSGGCLAALCMALGLRSAHVSLQKDFAQEAAMALNLQQWHLKRLKAQYKKLDMDGSGTVTTVTLLVICSATVTMLTHILQRELFETMGEVRSPFTDKLFELIDIDASGTIDFEEFVHVMATYCMFTKEEILKFCFETFDVDGSGTIDEKEFLRLCDFVNNGQPIFPGNFKTALLQFDTNDDGVIDYQEFLKIYKRFPLILFPAFRLQDSMQKFSLGERAWLRIIEDYSRAQQRETYRIQHNGDEQPETLFEFFGRLILCRSKASSSDRQPRPMDVGAAMQRRHSMEMNARRVSID